MQGDGEVLGGYEERLFTENKLNMCTLRDDVTDNVSLKEELLAHATRRKEDYYSVPNVNSKKHS
jgi:Asp-tRNA(Asn)/Glu-tRNA(Gln) amidotransferase C subunit